MRKAILGILFLILYFGVSAASYFSSAGRTDLPLAWAYFLINLGTGVIFSVILEIMNPGLTAERFKPGPGRAGSNLQDCQQHPDGSDAGCGGVRCEPVPPERLGRPVAADRRTGLGVSGIFVRHPATRELSRILPAASRGSWLATLIAGVPMIVLCRALLEDKMLREELAGYKEYAAKVNRLALGIW